MLKANYISQANGLTSFIIGGLFMPAFDEPIVVAIFARVSRYLLLPGTTLLSIDLIV
jgi:hypothetical protein